MGSRGLGNEAFAGTLRQRAYLNIADPNEIQKSKQTRITFQWNNNAVRSLYFRVLLLQTVLMSVSISWNTRRLCGQILFEEI